MTTAHDHIQVRYIDLNRPKLIHNQQGVGGFYHLAEFSNRLIAAALSPQGMNNSTIKYIEDEDALHICPIGIERI